MGHMQTILDLVSGVERTTPELATTDSLADALRLFNDHGVDVLPVVGAGVMVGMLTLRACTTALADGSAATAPVSEPMVEPVALAIDATVEEAMTTALSANLLNLPVVDDGRLVALVTIAELIGAILSDKELILDQALNVGLEKDGFLRQLKDLTFDKLVTLNRAQLHPLKSALEHTPGGVATQGTIVDITRRLESMLTILDRLSTWYFSEKSLESKRVLLAECDRKAQILTKMALGGTGVDLDIVDDLATGREYLATRDYDILCVNTEMIDLAKAAREHNPDIDMVFLTADDIRVYLPVVRDYPKLSNIVSRGENDRTFTVRSITTTINKLANRDIFGFEKYLAWGVDVNEAVITSSENRYDLLETMEADFRKLGLRRTIITKCATVAEELLLNAIYDAPHDADGKARYAHDRTAPIELARHEHGRFRWACDGVLAAISVEDPFGQVERDTILNYLESCYLGRPNPAKPKDVKGGAGQGIFMVMEIADLAVFNVKRGLRSEVIALLAVDLETRKRIKTSSFHFFGS